MCVAMTAHQNTSHKMLAVFPLAQKVGHACPAGQYNSCNPITKSDCQMLDVGHHADTAEEVVARALWEVSASESLPLFPLPHPLCYSVLSVRCVLSQHTSTANDGNRWCSKMYPEVANVTTYIRDTCSSTAYSTQSALLGK